MVGRHKISIWFIIGSLLLTYGIIIFGANVYDWFSPSQTHSIVLGELHFGVWWGMLLIVIGLIYFIAFRPWKKQAA
ncbi:MAG TPA: hypothetical protein VMU30_03200 [Bacteroidota bacterium]|nr:hypothetical protein [Bacteroidota bacterium]